MIDSAPIRRAAQREYDKIVRELERAKAERERFQSEDQPRYAKWLNSNFGAFLTEMRELQEKVFDLQGLVSEVQQEFYYGEYHSIHSAYTKVLRRREHPEEFADELNQAEQPEPDIQEELYEAFKNEFEKRFGDLGQDIFNQLFQGGETTPEPEPENPSEARLKELYRSLARKLHPDMRDHASSRHIEWWHQTQAAYEAADIEQLQLILTLTEIEEKGSAEAGISILQRIAEQFKKGLNALRRELRHFRKDPAWNFSQVNDFGPITARTRAMLQAERQRLAAMLERFQGQVNSWEALASNAKGTRPRTRRKTASREMDSCF